MNNLICRLILAAVLMLLAQQVSLADEVVFAEHLLQDGFGYAYGLAVGDLNGDGHLEITVGDATKGELSAFVKRDQGAYERFFIRRGEGSWLERHEIGDVDGDGLHDLVIVCNNASTILWFKNPGNPIAEQNWNRHVITQTFPHAYDVSLSDFNDDGRLDVAASSYKGDEFSLFLNPGPTGEWDRQTLEHHVGETRTIRTGDFNADGHLDLLGSCRTGNLVVWYENPAPVKGAPWAKHTIDANSASPMHGHPVDMNLDGSLDLVMAFGHLTAPESGQVSWYENVDQGKVWIKHTVGSLPNGFEAVAGDINGDNRLDIVATAWAPDTINGQLVWFESRGGTDGDWRKHLLKDQWARANSVLLTDLDNDKQLDIVAATENKLNEVRWWHNQGTPASKPSTGK